MKEKLKIMMSYPEAMRRDIDNKGMKWWAEGGSYDSFSEAIEKAKEVAEEKNFPIQISYMGKKMTVYPKSIGY